MLVLMPVIIVLFVILTALICFFRVFYSTTRRVTEEFSMPDGKIYEPYYSDMREWQIKVRNIPHADVEIKSHDGLTLRGKYYEYSKDAPIELMFHGYRGNSRSDLSGGVLRCFKMCRSVLTVDQRACGLSDGRVITFGAKESIDCERWVDFIVNNINRDARIILTGISMGAATVMAASRLKLPENVIGVIADCGYTSTKEIIKKVCRDVKLHADLLYPFIRLGAILFGHFDPNKHSPVDVLKNAKVPVIFIHGEADDFVPWEMSVENYNVCSSRKKLVIVKNAGHCLAYVVDPEQYLDGITEFFNEAEEDK